MANATGRPTAPLVLSEAERDYFERQVRKHRVARSMSERCRTILLCTDGIRLANGDGTFLKIGSTACSTKFALAGPERSAMIRLLLWSSARCALRQPMRPIGRSARWQEPPVSRTRRSAGYGTPSVCSLIALRRSSCPAIFVRR